MTTPRPKKGAVPLKRKPRAKAVPPPRNTDPYHESNLNGKCKRCVGKGELYVHRGGAIINTIVCTQCDGTGLEVEDENEDLTVAHLTPPAPSPATCQTCDGTGKRKQFDAIGNLILRVCPYCQGAGTVPGVIQGQSPSPTGRIYSNQLQAQAATRLTRLNPVTYSASQGMMSDNSLGDTFDDFFSEIGECARCDGNGIMKTSSGHAACGTCRGTGRG